MLPWNIHVINSWHQALDILVTKLSCHFCFMNIFVSFFCRCKISVKKVIVCKTVLLGDNFQYFPYTYGRGNYQKFNTRDKECRKSSVLCFWLYKKTSMIGLKSIQLCLFLSLQLAQQFEETFLERGIMSRAHIG